MKPTKELPVWYQLKFIARPLWRALRRALVIAAWGLGSLADAARNRPQEKRLLMIYDFGSQPVSIGDILIYQATATVLLQACGARKMDFVLVYEKEQPVVGDPAFSHITKENFSGYLLDLIAVSHISPAVGSLLVFDTHSALERFVDNNSSRYCVWPDVAKYAGKEYLYYYIFNDVLFNFHRKSGFLPDLSISPAMRAWAENFVLQHAKGHETISVQLRSNSRDPLRNSDYDAWFDFFFEAQARYQVKFILIGTASEVDSRFEGKPWMVIAKRHGTSIAQDLSLIGACRFHMGASSGPSVMAVFSKKPYCLFNTDVRGDLLKGTIVDGPRTRLFFATPAQSMLSGRETKQILMREFERMWQSSADADPKG